MPSRRSAGCNGQIDPDAQSAALPVPRRSIGDSMKDDRNAQKLTRFTVAMAVGLAVGTAALAAFAGLPITEYPIPTDDSAPRGITAGPDGNMWFTETMGRIGKITTTGVFTEYAPVFGSSGGAITGGPDGNVWFGSVYITTAMISKITPAGIIIG